MHYLCLLVSIFFFPHGCVYVIFHSRLLLCSVALVSVVSQLGVGALWPRLRLLLRLPLPLRSLSLSLLSASCT